MTPATVPTDQLVALLVVAIVANVILMAVVLVLPARPDRDQPPLPPEPADVARQVAARQENGRVVASASEQVYDRVIRVVSYLFLAVAAAIVALSGLYPATAPAIYALLALAAVFLLLIHDVLPPSVLGPGRFVLEGSVAIAVITVLIVLTGGIASPFFFGYFLVVAGAALVVRSGTAILAAATTSLVYLIAVASLPGSERLGMALVSQALLNVIALWLVAFLASVVAREQRRTRDAALRLSLYDPLTELYNRNYFFAVMDREIQRAARTGRRFCLLMIDMDDLKPINDRFGHHYGDRMLRAVAEVVRSGTRIVDSAARYGGDEFVVLLPETDPTGAFVVAEKLREGVSRVRLDADGVPVGSSVSIGLVAYPDDGTTADQLMISADAAMYESKRRGKNRVAGHLPQVRGGVMADESRPRPVRRRTTRRQVAGTDATGTDTDIPSGGQATGEEGTGDEPEPRRRRRRTPRCPDASVDSTDSTGSAASRRARRRFPVVIVDEDVADVMRSLLGPDRDEGAEPDAPLQFPGSEPSEPREVRPVLIDPA